MVSNVLSTGLQGVTAGLQGATKAADRIANAGISNQAGNVTEGNGAGSTGQQAPDIFESFAEPIVDLKIYQRNVEASVQVVKTADEMIGTLLNIKA